MKAVKMFVQGRVKNYADYFKIILFQLIGCSFVSFSCNSIGNVQFVHCTFIWLGSHISKLAIENENAYVYYFKEVTEHLSKNLCGIY